MAGNVKAKVETAKKAPYTVAGTTLEEIWADVEKKGPKVKGELRAGSTSTPAVLPNTYKFEEEQDTKKPPKKGEAWIVRAVGGEITISPTIKYPKLASDKDLSDEDKKAWETYISALLAHEDEHVKAAQKGGDALADKVMEVEGRGEGEDKKKALKAAYDDYKKNFKSAITASTVDDAMQEAHDKLDSGGHGPTLKFTKTK